MPAMRDPVEALNRIAESYVHLVLAVGLHDPDYVDAYYGPAEWKSNVDAQRPSLATLHAEGSSVLSTLEEIDTSAAEEMVRLRRGYLMGQLRSLLSRVQILQGKAMSFDDECQALYDAAAPAYSEHHFRTILHQLNVLLPGSGPVPPRYHHFKSAFVIPRERLDPVFRAAIEESRRRTSAHIPLPEGESFAVEYVTNKAWSGYNWYKGGGQSLIQINTDLPIYIDRAIDLGSHEGYPGHHVYNSLLEHHLVRGRGWLEFSVYALFSPQSLIAEGTANYGIDVAFPRRERVAFEQAVLFPLAGMDSAMAELYYDVHDIFLKLSYAGNEAARGYLDGTIGRDQALHWLMTYALMSHERAEQRIRFFDQYRSYVINYNLGQDLVKAYIEAECGTADNPAKRWDAFHRLLSSPILPSGLRFQK
jgi:hypothetical protein